MAPDAYRGSAAARSGCAPQPWLQRLRGGDANALKAGALCAFLTVPFAASAAPAFENYPPHPPHEGPNADVVIATFDERLIANHLRKGVEGPPDFSGRYKVVTWVCGVGCGGGAVVDQSSGRVHHLPETGTEVRHRIDSSLIGIRVAGGGLRHQVVYFQFSAGRFNYIATVRVD